MDDRRKLKDYFQGTGGLLQKCVAFKMMLRSLELLTMRLIHLCSSALLLHVTLLALGLMT